MFHDTGYGTYNDRIQVQVSDNGSSWTSLGEVARNDGSSGWKRHVFSLTSYAGRSIRLGFLGITAYGNDCHLDDLEVTYAAPGTCTTHPCSPGGPNPKEASAAGNPMSASKGSGATVGVAFTPACGATDHAAYWGKAGGPLSSIQWTIAACGLGTTGSASFDPGPLQPGAWVYFVVVGQNGAREGSYGLASSGERPEATGIGACDKPQDLTGTCP